MQPPLIASAIGSDVQSARTSRADACIAMQMSRVSGAARAASCLQPLIFIFILLQCTNLYAIKVTARLCQIPLQLCIEAHCFTSSTRCRLTTTEGASKTCRCFLRQAPHHVASRLLVTPNKKTPSATQPKAVASSSQLHCLRSCPAATPLPVLTA